MSIGEVLARLRPDFPDVTISKLRFLEAEGLIEPSRTPSGYRKYSWDDVARLRYILAAQRDHYLPLRVIRERLEADAPPRLALVGSDAPEVEPERPDRLRGSDLCRATGVDEEFLADLQAHGLLAPGPEGWYDRDAVTVVELAAGLAELGLAPRHLRMYRVAADREVGTLVQLVAPLLRQQEPGARAQAEERLRELVALSLRLRAVLVRIGLRGELGS